MGWNPITGQLYVGFRRRMFVHVRMPVNVTQILGSFLALGTAVLRIQTATHLARRERATALGVCAGSISIVVEEPSGKLDEHTIDEVIKMRIVCAFHHELDSGNRLTQDD